MSTKIIVCHSQDMVIGAGNSLSMPWRQSSDLKKFKEITMGSTIVMGRKTWQSLPCPLPGRRNVVLSRSLKDRKPGCEIFSCLHKIKDALSADMCFVIGGGQIFRLFLPGADTIYRTELDVHFPSLSNCVTFPVLPAEDWKVTESKFVRAGKNDDYDMHFSILQRCGRNAKTTNQPTVT